MRKFISGALEKDPDITVLGTAQDGEEALGKIAALNPDVVTLDIAMPRRDGLATLQEIMRNSPRPVIMVSSLTTEGAEVTLKCLDAGALDFIPKTTDAAGFAEELLPKIKAVARKRALMALRRSRVGLTAPRAASVRRDGRPGQADPPDAAASPLPRHFGAGSGFAGAPRDIVAIGVSTGGPPAVQKVLGYLPANFSASVLIAQHMPAAFTGPFAKRLDAQCAISVKEAEHGEKLQSGYVYIAPGGKHMTLEKRGATVEIAISTEPVSELYKPSATVLFNSVALLHPKKTLGVILTGMGSDGCAGIRTLKENGGYILAQNEASCVVYGMPKAVVDAGLADQILDIDEIGGAIVAAVQGK